MKGKTIFALVILLLPQPAFATGTFVVGCAEGGPLATPMGVASAATSAASSVRSTVKDVGKSLKGTQKKIIATINKNFEAQNSILRQILASMGTSREKMKHMRMFGPQSKAYGVGLVDGRWRNVMEGMKARSSLSGKFKDAIAQHSKEMWTKSQRSYFINTKKASFVSPSLFFPQDSVLSKKQLKKVKHSTKAIIDPFPTPELPESYKGSAAAKKYTSKRKIKYSYLAQPTAVMSDIISSYAPTMSLNNWSRGMYRKMGGSGKPSNVVNGKTSLMGYIDLMVDSRFANQGWYSRKNGIHSKTPTGLLRELLVMESVKMKMQNLQMKRMQQMSGLLAQEQAISTGERLNNSLDKLYEKVVTQ